MEKLHMFCFPKPWIPEFSEIQTAAVRSWTHLKPKSITLLGFEQGTSENAKKLGVASASEQILCNSWGTPLVSDIFAKMQNLVPPNELICYVNADIVLAEDFASTLSAVSRSKQRQNDWLMVGKRTDLSVPASSALQELTVEQIMALADSGAGKDHGWGGIDYFVFPSGLFQFVYPFALGKFVWDQWLLGNAYRRGCCTIDASMTIRAVHLNGDWYLNGAPQADREVVHKSQEALINRSFDNYRKNILEGTTHQTCISEAGEIYVKQRAW
jgi:hypothetical protein